MEEDSLHSKQRDLEQQNELKKLKQANDAALAKLDLEKEEIASGKKKQTIAFIIIILLLLAAIVFFYEKNLTSSKANELAKKEKDSLGLVAGNLDKTNTTLKNDIESKTKDKAAADSLVKVLKLNNSKLSAKTKQLAEESKNLASANSENLTVIKELKKQTEELKNKPEVAVATIKNKQAFLDLYKKQADSLIAGLQKTDPFVALALAKSNYQQVAGISGGDTVESFKKAFINVYNTTDFYVRDEAKFNKFNEKASSGGLIIDLQYDTVNNTIRSKYVLTNINSPGNKSETYNHAELLDTNYYNKLGFDVFYPNAGLTQTKIVTNGFSADGDLFYSINRTPRPKDVGFKAYIQISDANLHYDTLKVWKITSKGISSAPAWVQSIDVSGYDNFSIAFRKDRLLVFPMDKKQNLNGNGKVYDLKSTSVSEVSFKKRSFKKVASRIVDVSDDFKYVLTKEKDYYQIYDANAPDKLDTISIRRSGTSIVYFKIAGENAFVIYRSANNKYSFEYSPLDSKLRGASTSFPDGFSPATNKIIKTTNGFICFNLDGSTFEVWTGQGTNWKNKEYEIVPHLNNSNRLSTTYAYGTISHNNKYFALSNSSTILVYDLEGGKSAIFSYKFKMGIERSPLFNENDHAVVVENGSHIYYLFFDKQQKNSAEDIKQLLSSGYYKGAWPISSQKAALYGIKEE